MSTLLQTRLRITKSRSRCSSQPKMKLTVTAANLGRTHTHRKTKRTLANSRAKTMQTYQKVQKKTTPWTWWTQSSTLETTLQKTWPRWPRSRWRWTGAWTWQEAWSAAARCRALLTTVIKQLRASTSSSYYLDNLKPPRIRRSNCAIKFLPSRLASSSESRTWTKNFVLSRKLSSWARFWTLWRTMWTRPSCRTFSRRWTRPSPRWTSLTAPPTSKANPEWLLQRPQLKNSKRARRTRKTPSHRTRALQKIRKSEPVRLLSILATL